MQGIHGACSLFNENLQVGKSRGFSPAVSILLVVVANVVNILKMHGDREIYFLTTSKYMVARELRLSRFLGIFVLMYGLTYLFMSIPNLVEWCRWFKVTVIRWCISGARHAHTSIKSNIHQKTRLQSGNLLNSHFDANEYFDLMVSANSNIGLLACRVACRTRFLYLILKTMYLYSITY